MIFLLSFLMKRRKRSGASTSGTLGLTPRAKTLTSTSSPCASPRNRTGTAGLTAQRRASPRRLPCSQAAVLSDPASLSLHLPSGHLCVLAVVHHLFVIFVQRLFVLFSLFSSFHGCNSRPSSLRLQHSVMCSAWLTELNLGGTGLKCCNASQGGGDRKEQVAAGEKDEKTKAATGRWSRSRHRGQLLKAPAGETQARTISYGRSVHRR